MAAISGSSAEVDHRPRRAERDRYSKGSIPRAPWIVMETRGSPAHGADSAEPASTPANDLPGLYRDILDRVAALEQLGERTQAGRIRMAATQAYSAAWDETIST